MSSRSPLRQLRRLDKSSSNFHDRVSNVLYGEEYKQWVPTIEGNDLVGLVDYLDTVRCLASFLPLPLPRSSHRRLSIVSTLLVPLSGSVFVNSDMYAAIERYCHLPIHYRLKISPSAVSLSPRGVLVMCTKGGSTIRRFASNGLGSTPRKALGKPQRYTLTPLHPHLLFLTRLPDPLPGGCGVETLGTPKYCSPPWYHLQSTPAHLGMDARRKLDRIHQEVSSRRPAQSCKYSCCRI